MTYQRFSRRMSLSQFVTGFIFSALHSTLDFVQTFCQVIGKLQGGLLFIFTYLVLSRDTQHFWHCHGLSMFFCLVSILKAACYTLAIFFISKIVDLQQAHNVNVESTLIQCHDLESRLSTLCAVWNLFCGATLGFDPTLFVDDYLFSFLFAGSRGW